MYDSRGAIIVWDDPDQEACHHGNLIDTCQSCLAEAQEEEEEAERRSWELTQDLTTTPF
jgi:hypothetical protein